MAFPKTFLGIAVGWNNLGEIGKHYEKIESGGGVLYSFTAHAYCNTKVRIGRDEKGLFMYCPRCMVKVEKQKNEKE